MAVKAFASISLAVVNDGISVNTTTTYYLANNSSTPPALTDSGWSTATVLPTKEKKNLWQYIKTVLSDNSVSNSSPVIISYYSEDGKSVESVKIQYRISESKTAETGNFQWQDSQPDWVEGKFLLRRNVVTYILPDGSQSIETGPFFCETAWDKITELNSKLDNLKVGGQNLLTGSKTMTKDCSYRKGVDGPWPSGVWSDSKYCKIDVPSGSDVNECIVVKPSGMKLIPKNGDRVTLSFYAKSVATQSIFSSFLHNDKNSGSANKKVIACTNPSQIGSGSSAENHADGNLARVFVTWEYLEDAEQIPTVIVARTTSASPAGVYIVRPMLELASTPSDWVEAPEDIEEETNKKVNAAKTEVKAEIKVETDQIKSQVEAITTRTGNLESGLDETKKNLETSKAIYIDIIETPSDDSTLFEATVFRDGKVLSDLQVSYLGALNWYSGDKKIGSGKSITRSGYESETLQCRLETGGDDPAEFITLVDGTLAVKGINLLKNSSFSSNYDSWGLSGSTDNVSFTEKGGFPCAKVTLVAGQSQSMFHQGILEHLLSGQTLTFSADIWTENIVKGTTNPLLALYIDGYTKDGNNWVGTIPHGGNRDYPINNGKWERIYSSFEPNIDNINRLRVYTVSLYARDFQGSVYIKNVKLEYGTEPTAWSPAPEEVD